MINVLMLAALVAAAIPADTVRGRVLVANQQAASATLIDLDHGTSHEIAVGDGPHEAAISHDGRIGAISIYGTQPAGNRIALIDMDSAKVLRMIDLGSYRRPHGMRFLPGDSILLATSEASSNVLMIGLSTGSITTIPTNARGSHMLAVDAKARRLFTANVGDGSISEIDLVGRRFVASYPIAQQTEGISITPDGRHVWVGSNREGTVTVFDADEHKVVATIPDMGMPYRLAVAPDARTVLVANPGGEQVHVIDATSHRLIRDIAVAGSPEGLFFTPDSRFAFITLNRSNEVALVDVNAGREIRRYTVGLAPDGVAFTPRR